MTAPILELIKKLAAKEFVTQKGSRLTAHSISKFTALPTRDLILRYRTILNGILNFYSFADNKPRLAKIHWILRESLKKTLCRKLKLNNENFMKKFGKDIFYRFRRKDGVVIDMDFKCPNLARSPMKFFGTTKFRDPFAVIEYKISTIRNVELPCANCNSNTDIEMHHVKHIRTINPNLSPFDKMMARINRKQVPLCRKCHLEVHMGKYHGKSLQFYKVTP